MWRRLHDNKELMDGEDVARCASCSLIVRVIYDIDDFACDEEDVELTVSDEDERHKEEAEEGEAHEPEDADAKQHKKKEDPETAKQTVPSS
eukprot:m.45772 g.45772  ORF g.45772 m.45772 type:complete len:91 (-) comp12201_c0_seq3:206-478(-)